MLKAEFGKGFSVDTLENMRKFYLVYQDRISEKASRILDVCPAGTRSNQWY